MSYLAKGQTADAEATYKKMAGLSKWGASEASLGLADMAIYRGSLAEAVDLLQKGMVEDAANNDKAAAGLKEVILAAIQMSRHQRVAALQSAAKAAQTSDDESVLYPTAEVFLEAGDTAKALQMADKLDKRFEPQSRALGTLIYGESKMKDGKFPDAVSYYQDAQKLADTWLGRLDLGRAYLAAGSYPDAENEFDVCIKRRGEATAVFLDDNPTLRYIPPVYYYEGRAREGLQSPSAAEFYKTFLSIKQAAEADPLVADGKRRLK
jgi:tetratricopeptide (TPR) repeat protein